MNLDQEGWRLQPDKCRADLDFIEWARLQPRPRASILQMGPGLHHQVGLQLGSDMTFVVSLTASPAERAVWDRMLSRRPGVGTRYVCLLQDVYNLRLEAMQFDTLYLPHWGEMLDDKGLAQTAMMRLLERLEFEGRLIFYTGSSAWDRTQELPRIYPGLLELEGTYKSLEIWRNK